MRNLPRLLSLLALALSASACTIEFIDQGDDDDQWPFDGGSFWPDAQQLDSLASLDAGGELCGDGLVQPLSPWNEVCDDGNNFSGDGCSADCQSTESCGNGIVDVAGEQCDTGTGSDAPTCDSDCTVPLCGDGHINTTAGEICEPGIPGVDIVGCDNDCTGSLCGDGHVNTADGEQCDDGNLVNNDGCTNACLLPSSQTCGNGAVEGSEQCDNGMPGVNSAICDRDCTLTACGDALVNFPAGEQCDTGGASATCDGDCTAVVCGDGVVNPAANEQCDDGNFDDLDGCNNNCTLP